MLDVSRLVCLEFCSIFDLVSHNTFFFKQKNSDASGQVSTLLPNL